MNGSIKALTEEAIKQGIVEKIANKGPLSAKRLLMVARTFSIGMEIFDLAPILTDMIKEGRLELADDCMDFNIIRRPDLRSKG